MADDARADVAPLRYATQTGRPWGDESFLDRLEAVLGRPVRPRRADRADQAA